jgi:capsular exopolysaccharide synthesis family protein
MSRIHDALKKAEQEKAAGLVAEGVAGPRRAIRYVAPPSDVQPERAGGQARKPGQLLREDPVKVGLLKTLEERCRQCTWAPHPNLNLFMEAKNHPPGAEEFRSLRSRLYLTRAQQPLRKLLITSALPEEGKTFASLNLSLVMAQQPQCRVLLIDADLRLPQIYRLLGAPATPGLSDYLDGTVDEFAIVQQGALQNFYFIPSGKLVPNPSELIGNGRLQVLLNRLAPAFEWVILDSPPVIPVSDARLLAGMCDGTLLLVRAGQTPFDLARKACMEFRDRGLLGVVLNGVQVTSNYSNYYGRPGKE